MDVTMQPDPVEFWRRAGALFEADPVRHTVALTALRDVVNGRRKMPERPLLVTITEGGAVRGAAVRAPPRPLVVSGVPAGGAGALARFLRDQGVDPNGVSGPRDAADAVASSWTAVSGRPAELVMNMRLYRLTRLREPEVAGRLEVADERSVPLLARYRAAFAAEATPHAPTEDARTIVGESIRSGNVHGIWRRDGVPRACAVASRPVSGMSRISAVYTPWSERGHGYGSAVTAGLARWCLDHGVDNVVLFTDMSNPTSNSIYRRIGFVAYGDAVEYTFARCDAVT
ncbi:GNAT family N-acetyltransferase [Haloechinothrix sp. YIM 98757]|uniref:GNAT family N-acetyltransferase n=1 Tax=Haloechinothrix aidingensis TaxID=2752311 RepID=A0A838ACR9_9PSEU|nr:GNAT family N-acetyltransferase [Haloechinothrix aidingensis]MBA0127062.1 GNAT family N-acetyltransferase [Haloechinothrix aidingensis]